MQIDAATGADLDELERLAATAPGRAWTRETLQNELDLSWSSTLVLRKRVDPRMLAGFIVYWRIEDELQIQNMVIDPDSRGRGLGTELLRHTLQAAQRARIATLEVRADNLPAIALYERDGFEVVGVRQGYYEPDGADAVLYSKKLSAFCDTLL